MERPDDLLPVEDPEWSLGSRSRLGDRAVLLELLGDLPVFDTLTWRELGKIERIVHRRRFGAGEVVLRAWVPRSGLFVVVSGSVNVVRTTDDGSEIVVGELGEGELLGEFALLDDTPRSTSILAAEPSELVGFFRPDLMDLVATDPRLGFKVLYRLTQAIAGQFRSDNKRLRRVRCELEAAGFSE